MRPRRIEVVSGAVEVRRHRSDEVTAILPAVRLAEPDARDFCEGVRLVGRLERTAEEVLLENRLRAVSRVDAGAPEVEQPLGTMQPAGFHDRGVDHQVVVDELRRARAVGQDPPDRAGDQKDVLGLVGLEPVVHRRLVAEIELVTRRAEDPGEPGVGQASHEGRADQTAVAGDIDSCRAIEGVCRHAEILRSFAEMRPTAAR